MARRYSGDDKEIFVIRKDFSGGQNNRIHGSNLADNQATVLSNVELSVPGQRSKRRGATLVEDISNNPITGLLGFNPDGSTFQLVATEGTTLWTWPSTGSFISRKTDFTTSLQTTMFKIGESGENDVFVVGNGTDNWFRFSPSNYASPQDLGNGNTSPPRSTVGLYYRNRFWVLKSNQLYWSDAFATDYSTAFDRTTNAYRIPVGTEQAVIGIRDAGIVALGADQVWGINPSIVPAATDKPEKILDIGCVAGNTAVQVGDDVYFLASDGVRGVFRTAQDKLQLGSSYPLSYALKEEFESLSWAYITKACAVYFENKYLISVPVDASTYNNEVWVYYPATQGWSVISGWNVSAWAKLKINGQEFLFYGDANDGKVLKAFSGFSDNGSAITYTEEGKKEDFSQALIKKVGGVLKVRALSSGSYDIDVYASKDDEAYTLLGTMNLAGNAPTLPVTLPFTLSGTNIVEEQFHLDSLGEFLQLRIKLAHDDLNGSDDITIYDWSVTTYATEYQSE